MLEDGLSFIGILGSGLTFIFLLVRIVSLRKYDPVMGKIIKITPRLGRYNRISAYCEIKYGGKKYTKRANVSYLFYPDGVGSYIKFYAMKHTYSATFIQAPGYFAIPIAALLFFVFLIVAYS